MSKLSGLFDNIVSKESEENSIPKVTDSFKDLIDSTSDDSKSTKKKKSSNKKRKKTQKELIYTIDEPERVLRMSALDPRIVLNTEILSIDFPPNEEKGTSDVLELTYSWKELLVFLLGAYQFKYPMRFEELISTSGVLGPHIQLTNTDRIFLDTEIEDGIEVYRIPSTEYRVEICKAEYDLFNSITKCMSLLGINIKETQVRLVNPLLVTSKEDIVELTDVTRSLDDIIENGMPLEYYIKGVGIFDEFLDCEDLRSGVVLLLCYAIIMYEQPAIDAMVKHTIKDVIGVTDDNQQYFGFIRTTPLVECNYYFYTNGQTLPMLKYVGNIFRELGVTPEYIEFNYSIKSEEDDFEIEVVDEE